MFEIKDLIKLLMKCYQNIGGRLCEGGSDFLSLDGTSSSAGSQQTSH